jgi:hypothetical protein
MNRIRETIPKDEFGRPIARSKKPKVEDDTFTLYGDPGVELMGAAELEKEYGDELEKFAAEHPAENETGTTDGTPAEIPQSVNDLISRHGKAIAAVCGPEAVEALTALAGSDEAAPVQESRRRGTSPPIEELFASLLPRKISREEIARFVNRLR